MQILHGTSRRSLLPLAMALTPPETQHKAPAESPWLEHPTRSGLRDRLQLAYDCWTLLELPNGTSRRPLYLPRGIEEAETCYIKRLEAARPNGFYRDALRTYAGMLSRLALQELPDSLTHVATDVDGQGTDLGGVPLPGQLAHPARWRLSDPATATPVCQRQCRGAGG